ncbi:hypothetical protein VP193E371_P0162 [Vibrio phage 193E37-1]|nr:hypothetical protein VP495E541_P0160 [Vibrio phage 495E54-1]CAH9014129.1 hypothetical protein VP496E541_P0161 [Vibrio phage 496E54-1]CAH9017228.1 hypothetical protein VP193E371_P0162 [Vibrio phage 193E37-1]
MITMKDSSFNGWYCKDVKNGLGEVVCKKCGFKMQLLGGMTSLNIKEHDCNADETNYKMKGE